MRFEFRIIIAGSHGVSISTPDDQYETASEALHDLLNRFGREGWDLAAATSYGTSSTLFMRRELE